MSVQRLPPGSQHPGSTTPFDRTFVPPSVQNALRISVVNMVASVLIFLGKVSVAACAGVIAYAMTEAEYYNSPERYPDTYLYSPVLVIAVAVISAYCIAGGWRGGVVGVGGGRGTRVR